MKLSPLQTARYGYEPKLPGMLRNGIAEISVQEGAATQSVADQEKIKALFPNTYGKPEITFVKGANTSAAKKQVVGVILSGGQAPGGHNVISGLYDALKAVAGEGKEHLFGFNSATGNVKVACFESGLPLRCQHSLECGDVAYVDLSVAVDVGGIKPFVVFFSVERYVVELRKTFLNEGGVLNIHTAVAVCVAAYCCGGFFSRNSQNSSC